MRWEKPSKEAIAEFDKKKAAGEDVFVDRTRGWEEYSEDCPARVINKIDNRWCESPWSKTLTACKEEQCLPWHFVKQHIKP